MVKNVQIIRVNENNWQNYKWFLGYGMKNEFPADEQLSMDQILHRVATPTEHDGKAQHIISVIEGKKPEGSMDNRGFIIYHIYQTPSGPFALIEYTAAVGPENKRHKYGTALVEEVKKSLREQGVEQIVLETEMVPRVVETPVHTDLEEVASTYTQTGSLWTISKGAKPERWPGVDQRNNFWERRGFNIIPLLAYCQPDLEKGIVKKRVPLDLQIAFLGDKNIKEVPVNRIKDIIYAMAKLNYGLGIFSENFVELQTTRYDGKSLDSSASLEVVPYSELKHRPEVAHAMRIHSVESGYK